MRDLKKYFILFVLIFLFSSLVKNIWDYQKILQFYQKYKENYTKEKKIYSALQTRLLRNDDPYQIEKIIRNKLNLSKKDEVSILLPNPTPIPNIPRSAPTAIYKQWWAIFFQN